MVRSIACAGVVLLACLATACLSDPGVHCADGTLCPADTTCAALAGVTHCVTAAQQAACAGAATGAPCDLSGTGDGVCNGGACIRRGCRDGFLSVDEKCDGTLLGDETCESRGYHGGVLACHDDCTFDVSACSGICGDGVISDAEDCDPGKPDLGVPPDLGGATCAIGGFYQPAGLACSEACRFEFAACGGGRCGDGVVDPSEQCEAGQLGDATCQSVGGFYDRDGLACNDACRFDVSACTGRCGDGQANGDEECDQGDLGAATTCDAIGFYGPTPLGCTAACTYDRAACAPTGFCGDGVINGAEQCDGDALAGANCQSAGGYYEEPGLACNSECRFDFGGCSGRCGDGEITNLEACEPGIALDAAHDTCGDFGYYNTAAAVTCSGICQLDVSACSGRCGDGAITDAEQCDGAALGGASCASYDGGGWYGGAVSCDAGCRLDGRACVAAGRCGDGVKNGPTDATPAADAEQCDGADFAGASCLTPWLFADGQPRYQGQLRCTAACAIDPQLGDPIHGCRDACGDGRINGPEVCDGTTFVGDATCQAFGYQGGELFCVNQCRQVAIGCVDRCGDGVVQGDEECDGRAQTVIDGACTAVGEEGGLACTSFCRRDTSACASEAWTARTITLGAGPVPTDTIHALASPARREVWALAGSPSSVDAVLYGDGVTWQRDTTAPGQPVAITSDGVAGVWIADAAGDVFARVGGSWAALPGAPLPAPALALWADPTRLFAATSTQVWRRGATAWTLEPVPGPIEAVTAIAGRPGGKLAVLYQRAGTPWLAERTAAGAWTTAPIPVGGLTLRALALPDDRDVWVTGGDGQAALLARVDGDWQPRDPAIPGTFGPRAIEGTAVGIAVGVGDDDGVVLAGRDANGAGWLATLSGTTWTRLAGPYAGFVGMLDSGHGDLWAYGGGPVTAHRESDGWRRQVPTGVDLTLARFAAVAVTATDVWIAGELMSGGVLRYREAQPSGARWERQLPGANVQRVLARTPTDVWAFSFDRQAWRWDGSSWTATTIPFDGASISAAVLIGATLYAADSASQTVWRTSGGAWVAHATWPPTTYAEALAGTGPDDLWIGGTDLYHYSGGGAFDPAFVPSQVSRITAMWAVSPDDVWIAGEHDNAFVIGHRSIPGPFGPPAFVALDDGPHLGGALRAMWGVGPADIWAVGDGGGLYHYDGQRWAPIEPATGAVATALTAVGGAGPARVWAVGDAGVILRQRDALPPLAAPPCADAVALYCMENMPPLVGTIPAGGRALYRFDPPYRASISLTLDARAIASPRTLGLRILGRDPDSGRCALGAPLVTASTPTANLQVPTPGPTTPPLVVPGHAPVFIELTATGATTGTGFELYLGCANPP
jgi:hypothetical protein